MRNKEQVLLIVYDTIDEFNRQFQKKQQLVKAEETGLYGQGKLDSVEFVSFIVAVEEQIAEKLNLTITLADEKAMSMRNSPFRTVGTLVKYIQEILLENDSD